MLTIMRLFLILLTFTAYNAVAEVFKTINPDGSISYSDVQTDNAEAVTLPELTPVPAVKLPKKKVANATEKDKKKALPYKSFSLNSPKDQATIFSNTGSVNLSLAIKPSLQTKFKHSISASLDGKTVKNNLTSASFQLNNLDRGKHTISAQILDADKKVLKSSKTITVYIKQHSSLHNQTPSNPNTPRPGYYVPPPTTPTPTPTPTPTQ